MKIYKGWQKGLLFGFVFEAGTFEINIGFFWMIVTRS